MKFIKKVPFPRAPPFLLIFSFNSRDFFECDDAESLVERIILVLCANVFTLCVHLHFCVYLHTRMDGGERQLFSRYAEYETY